MRGVQVLAGALLALAAAGQQASAATTDVFDWTLTSPGEVYGASPVTGSGKITATEGSGGVWTVDSITGSFTDIYGIGIYGITGSTGVGYNGDSEIYPSNSSVLDGTGLSFDTTYGNILIYGTPANGEGYYVDALGLGQGTGDFTLAATPLPAALPLFAGGLGLFGVIGRRKKRKAIAA